MRPGAEVRSVPQNFVITRVISSAVSERTMLFSIFFVYASTSTSYEYLSPEMLLRYLLPGSAISRSRYFLKEPRSFSVMFMLLMVLTMLYMDTRW